MGLTTSSFSCIKSFYCLLYFAFNFLSHLAPDKSRCIRLRHLRHSRHTDEGGVATVEEGAVDDLQDEGEVLERQDRDGGADREQQALQRRQEEGEDGSSQVGFLLTLPCEQPTAQPSGGKKHELLVSQQTTACVGSCVLHPAHPGEDFL